MKIIVKKIMSDKKFIIFAGIMLVIIACVGGYTLYGINKNLKELAAIPPQTEYNFATYPVVDTTGKDADLIKRGEYLTKAGDCVACHTNSPEKGKPFAGGLPFQTPFGTLYSPNLTPDKETGIGNWTEADFTKAMRHGVSPKGEFYYPAFPYYYFSTLTDGDLHAIHAYLNSIPAIHQANRDNAMVPPFNIRFMQLGWRILFFYHNDHGAYKDDSKQTPAWNRGKYLVDGLGHCAMCHSPSYNIFSNQLPLAAPILKYNLTGAAVQGYLAPNIIKSNFGNVPDEEFVNVFMKDEMVGGGKVQGPMLEVNHDSLRYMTQEDLTAIVQYLKTVDSEIPPKPSGGPGVGTYEGYCSGCHAMGSGGAPKMGDTAAWDALVKKSGKEKLYQNAIHGIGGMPAKGTCSSCSDDEIKATVDYMISGGSGDGGAGTIMQLPKPMTPEQGKAAYEKNCSSCHNGGDINAPKPGDMAAWQPILAKGFSHLYLDVAAGHHGHPKNVCVDTCSDADIKAALKYMLQQSTTTNNYNLW